MKADQPPSPSIQPTRADAVALATLCSLIVFLFFDVLFDAARVYSHWRGDTFRYFVHYRQFGFDELARGNLPLWNPHTFAGVPFVGGFQSAMFYPLNLVYLLLPIGTALDVEALLATILMATFSYAWARNAEQTPLAAFLVACTATFGATFWLRIMAGMETVTSTLAWCPLLFLATDRTLRGPTLGTFLLLSLGFAMQLLAGYPTYSALTVLALGIYVLCRLPGSAHRVRTLVWLSGAGVFALGLSAIQLGPGMETAVESVRSLGISFGFASSFPMPPENMWLLLAPELFGNVLDVPYWGRSFYWDANPYFGTVALVLALLGVARGPRGYTVAIAVMAAFFGLASLGRYLPIYFYLYEWIPFLQVVRAPSKLLFFACFPLALAAGFGVDALRSGQLSRAWIVLPVLFAGATVGGAWFLGTEAGTTEWNALLSRTLSSHEAWYELCAEHLAAAPALATRSLLLAGGAAAALCAVWLAPPRMAAAGAVVLATAQLLSFATSYRGSFDLEWIEEPTVEAAARHGGLNQRIFNPGADLARNRPMGVGGAAVWGYEPVTLGRYSRFIRIASNFNLTEEYLTALRPMRLGRHGALLRVGTLIKGPKPHVVGTKPFAHLQTERDPTLIREPVPGALGRFLLVSDWKLTDFNDYRRAKRDLFGLRFRTQALLEESPGFPAHQGRVRGNARLVQESNDEMIVDVTVDQDTLLVVTDAYSTQWRAEPVAPGGPQSHYEVIPANLALRGIPLEKGSHRIRLFYDSPGLLWGATLSAISAVLYLILAGAFFRSRARTQST